jgi:ABC-type sugar transport system ATPase subunit
MVEIARAVSADCKVLILDESTSALSETEQSRLYQLIERLKTRRIGILYISHKLDEVRQLSDTLTVMRDGRRVATVPTAAVDHGEMVEMMVGRIHATASAASPASGAIGLQVSDLSSAAAKVCKVTFAVRRGEIVGLAGLLGSGRSELFETLFGMHRIDSGEIRVHGCPVRLRSPASATTAGVALVPEDRRNQGIFPGLPVWKNAALAACGDLFGSAAGWVRQREAQAATRRDVERFGIKTATIAAKIEQLSGGNQQKGVLARWLMRSPAVLLLDDPTAGIDVGGKGEIHAVVRELAARGMSVVVSSSEFSELIDLCHRILVIRGGALVGEMDPQICTEAELVHAASVKDATSGIKP